MAVNVKELAEWVEARWTAPEVLPEVLEHAPDLTPEAAYRVQRARMEARAERGDRIIGYKAALTSKPMQERAGIDEPVLGTLLQSGLHDDGVPVSLRGFIRATVEPEVTVLLGRDLMGPGVTRVEALAAVAGYLPSLEIGDMRNDDHRPRSLQQTIVCNTFNGGHVIGAPLGAPDLDLRTEGMVIHHNGEVHGSATAVEVLGDPLNSVAFMANKLGELGYGMQAGQILMTGSIIRSFEVQAGDTIEVDFTRLGRLRVRFTA